MYGRERSRCVRNAECCNLPAHFVCKCQPGFEGDGEVECRGKNTKYTKKINFFRENEMDKLGPL